MPIEDFEIVGSYDTQRFTNIDDSRTINMFEYIDAMGKKPRALISTSGLADTELEFPFAGATDGFRAQFVLNGFEYVVIGPNLYSIDSLGNVVRLNSSLQPILGTGFVGIDANNAATGPQILIVDGQLGSIYDTGTDLFIYNVHAVDPAFPQTPIDVTFLDGFLIVAVGGTNTFQLSALNNAYSWGTVANTFTADDTVGNNWLIVSTLIPTGTEFRVSTTGTLPNPLLANTSYYAISVFNAGVIDPNHIRVALTYSNALLGTAITLTTNGTPTNTITNAGINSTSIQVFVKGQLQLGAINSHPGDIVACRTLHRRLFLFSSNFTEVWENSGQGTNLPVRRNSSLLIELGTPSIGSIVTGFDKMMFLSQDRDGQGAVIEVMGTSPIPISNRALDFQLAQYASDNQVSDARGIFIKENGIIFYRLNFTSANVTYVYNQTLSNPAVEEGKLWHQEQVLNGDRHPAQTHGYFNGNNYYGSYDSPVLYQVDQSFTTNNGEAIPRIRISRCYVSPVYTRLRIDRFMLDCIQGQTNISNLSGIINLLAENGNIIETEGGVNIILDESPLSAIYDTTQPPVFLSYSKDGGVTFGYRQTAYLGAMGDRTHRTVWRKLGVIPRGQGFVAKIEFFSNVPFTILGAAWSFEVMPE